VVFQIHYGEGDFAHHVDPSEIRIELDGVEDPEASVDQRCVRQMRVAVALADESLFFPGLEGFLPAPRFRLAPGANLRNRRDVSQRLQMSERLPDGTNHGVQVSW